MIFPLGLGGKPRLFPFVTVALVVLNVLVFALDPKYFERYAQEVTQLLNLHPVSEAEFQRALPEFCREEPLAVRGLGQRCQTLHDELKDVKPPYSVEGFRRNAPVAKTFRGESKGIASYFFLRYIVQHRLEKGGAAQTGFRREYQELLRRNHFYSRYAKGFLASTRAQFSHAGVMHLIFNMLFLLIFGVYVESRLARAYYLMLFAAGGLVGFGVALLVDLRGTEILMGNSASVSAVMGAYLVLFWRHPMRCLYWLLPPLSFRMPTFWVLVFGYVGMDLVGTLAGESHVAHGAHVGGWTIGILAAFLWRRLDPLPYPYIYQHEGELSARLAAAPPGFESLDESRLLLSRNEDNLIARKKLVEAALFLRSVRGLDEERFDALLQQEAPSLFTALRRQGKEASLLRLLSRFPAGIPMAPLLAELKTETLKELAERALQAQEARTFFRLTNLLMNRLESRTRRSQLRQQLEVYFEREPASAKWREESLLLSEFFRDNELSPECALLLAHMIRLQEGARTS